VSDKSGATARAERKKDLMAEAVTKELGKEMQVTHLNDEANTRIYTFGSHEERVASLEASIEQLTNTLAVMMTSDVTPTANEVCFSDLPFDPTSTL
jgi:UDP-N-acetyl-D-mannosaminuronic acid transferase (WecB/TagA/CpsF family)